MADEPDLFERNVFEEFLASGVVVEETQRISYGAKIKIGDKWYDAVDIHECLAEVEDGHTYLTDSRMGQALVDLAVLRSYGSMSWPAREGPNFKAFQKVLADKLKKLPHYGQLEC